jgi:hypothetical protein
MRQWLWDHQFALVGATAALIFTTVLAWTVVTWPSSFERWTSRACDGIRQGNVALANGDLQGLRDGLRQTGSLDPAGDTVRSDSTDDLTKLWSASDALLRIVRRLERSSEALIPLDEQWLVLQGVDVCRSYTYPWYGPARLLS